MKLNNYLFGNETPFQPSQLQIKKKTKAFEISRPNTTQRQTLDSITRLRNLRTKP